MAPYDMAKHCVAGPTLRVSDPGHGHHRGAAAAGDAGAGDSSAGQSGRLDLLALPRQASLSGLGAVSNVGSTVSGRGLHSSTFELNLSRFGCTSPCPPV
jgi:hypothetical protein